MLAVSLLMASFSSVDSLTTASNSMSFSLSARWGKSFLMSESVRVVTLEIREAYSDSVASRASFAAFEYLPISVSPQSLSSSGFPALR